MILAGAEWWETLYSLVELGEILDSREDYSEFFRSISLSDLLSYCQVLIVIGFFKTGVFLQVLVLIPMAHLAFPVLSQIDLQGTLKI